MVIPVRVDYPVVAITDVHGQLGRLDCLLDRLSQRPDWSSSALVFVGDYVDRGPEVKATVERVLRLVETHPGGAAAVMGNHDLALVRAAGLDGGPRSDYWIGRYRTRYDPEPTFRSYLRRDPDRSRWDDELRALRDAIPERHRAFLAGLPWLVESSGHLFLHCGLSPELGATAEEQIDALHARRWDVSLRPAPGTETAALWEDEYPVWLGADKNLSASPLPAPGRVQVTGHRPVAVPEVDAVRIRLDTSGGEGGPLTACVLSGPGAAPQFVRGGGPPR